MRLIGSVLAVCLLIAFSFAQQQQLNVMPLPATYELGSGHLVIDSSFSVSMSGHQETRLGLAVERFLRDLSRQTGMPLNTKMVDSSSPTLVIQCDHQSKEVQELGEDESYELEVTTLGARLTAPTPLGVLHGLQTFLQLVQTTPSGFAAPAVNIHDKPRFPWRGLMIDVSRHFMPVEVLKRNLDGMAAVKLNVFHWHLSDNQGFRVESKQFPKLQELGSDGQYYTQDEVRDLIGYAHERGIRVVPEFDMPGHSTAWFAGYPELASAPGPYQIERKWGIFDPAMDPANEKTYEFLNQFIGEMAQLFPDQYFHIGGDEVNGKQWAANPKIREFMRAYRIRDNQQLQAYFNQRIQAIVSKHGKTMMGWDEILSPDLPKSIVIQSWRGQQSLADAVRQGYSGLLSAGYYLDLMWPAARHYAVDPLSNGAASLSPEEQQRILGGEACMWSEYASPENIDSRIWPHTAAIAERLWSPQEVRDASSMYLRLDEISWRLGLLGLTHQTYYEPMLQRIAGTSDVTKLRTLADVVEPVKEYKREELAAVPPTQSTPLIRLIDAVRPESTTARRFANLVDALLSDKTKSATEKTQIRLLLTRWRDNALDLQPLFGQSFLLKEDIPLSQSLSALGAAGLIAMDYLDSGKHSPDAWRAQALAQVEEAKKPKAQLLLMVASPVGKLIFATGGTSGSPAQ
jgi:hexosaminidase